MRFYIEFHEIIGYKVYYETSWSNINYLPMEGEWGISPFIWYGMFNKDFQKLAIL